MVLHPAIHQFLESMPQSDSNQKIIPEEHRNAMNTPVIPLEERVQVHSVEEQTIPTKEGDVNVRIYTPELKDAYPILMYFHGGAFFSGSLESHDEIVRPIAMESGYKVISVDYCLAPEHPFPAALEDCYNVTKWAREHIDELNWDGENLAVAGDSSGGNLAAAVSLVAKEKKEFTITKQILYYPSLDLDFDRNRYLSLMENRKGNGLETDALPEYNSFYLSGGADPTNPLVSPIKAESLENLPSALVITAEHDPLRDEGELYAEKLKNAGVEVMMKRYEGTIHGFLAKWTHLDEYKDVYRLTGDFLKKGI
ncbi:alpha/beta hydrolase [Oceanobacillus senegalensis]|uniref:alpha/beta hydrolase n=1 Tax=Oceanobacillus senegalensis TaxID=1936063 RepID=UPI000A307164|nr:alpha/beta hydrolase [Oceanobacillus senegalensis]